MGASTLMDRSAASRRESQTTRLARRGIVVVALLYLFLGLLYSTITPIFEASDEIYHYPVVKYLADQWARGDIPRLPVQRSETVGPWHQEGSQPPLYYLLASLLTHRIDTSDFSDVRKPNPHADIGSAKPDRNANMVVHTPHERFPYAGTVLAVHLVRCLSVLLGLGTVLAGYGLSRTIFPGDTVLALATACLVAFNSMFLFISGSVNNDTLANLFGAVCLWLVVRFTTRAHRVADWVLLGALLGLGSLSKLSLLGMLPLVALVLVHAARQRRSWRYLFLGGLALGMPILLLGGWWYWRNWRLYGDPTGLSAFIDIVGPRFPKPSLRQLLAEWRSVVPSFWGLYGGMNVLAPKWFYAILSGFAVLGLFGTPLAFWQRLRETADDLGAQSHSAVVRQLALVVLWPLTLLVSLIRWTFMTPSSQGRLLFPGLTALSLLMAMGLDALFSWTLRLRRYRAVLPIAMCVFMFGTAVLMPFSVIRPAYAPPDPVAQLGEEVVPVEAVLGGKVRLLGYELQVAPAVPGEGITLTLYWEGVSPIHEDYSVFVHLLATNDLIVGQRDRYPGGGNLPTSLWAPGAIVVDRYVVPLSRTALTPDTLEIAAGLYRSETGERLEAATLAGDALGDAVRFGRIALPRREADGVPNPVFADLDGRIALVGYDLDRTAVAPGEDLHLRLFWRALTDIDVNYSVFTQVIDTQHNIWAQSDGWPLGGDAPTALWREGQVFEDPYILTVRDDAPAGAHDLHVGMYDQTGKRLRLVAKEGHAIDDRVVLGKIRVLGR